MRHFLPAIALLAALWGCGGEEAVEPPAELALVREAVAGEARHRGGTVKIRFAPAGPFSPRPCLLVSTPPGSPLHLEVRLELPGVEDFAEAAGEPLEPVGRVALRLPGEDTVHRLSRAGLEIARLPGEGILPRARIAIAGRTAAGVPLTLRLEGPVTTLDGSLVFQE